METNSFLLPKNISNHDISNIPIFGTYKNREDQLTVALLHIIKVGGEELLQEIVGLAGIDLQTAEMQVTTQVSFVPDDKDKKERGCRVDGFIFHECGYSLYMETKITCNAINVEQLTSYRKISVGCMQKIILYVTPDEKRPKELDQNEAWVNWELLLDLLKEYIADEPSDSLLKVYVENIIMLYNLIVGSKIIKKIKKNHTQSDEEYETELLKWAQKKTTKPRSQLWGDEDANVLIVGGKWGEPVALKYGFYACQPGRTFLSTRYLAFYHRNRIKYLFQIEEAPRDVETIEGLGISSSYFSEKEPNYENYSSEQKRRKFFKLQLVYIFQVPIKNNTLSKTGKRTAYTQNQRYTTIGKMLTASTTSDL